MRETRKKFTLLQKAPRPADPGQARPQEFQRETALKAAVAAQTCSSSVENFCQSSLFTIPSSFFPTRVIGHACKILRLSQCTISFPWCNFYSIFPPAPASRTSFPQS
jgi:hypothetical protein